MTTLRLFRNAFNYLEGVRQSVHANALRYELRVISHINNGQIDVVPIAAWFYPNQPWTVSSNRRLYLTIALEPSFAAKYKVVMNFALDYLNQNLGVLIYKVEGSRKTDLISDTTSVSIGSDPRVALQVLQQLQKALKIHANR